MSTHPHSTDPASKNSTGPNAAGLNAAGLNSAMSNPADLNPATPNPAEKIGEAASELIAHFAAVGFDSAGLSAHLGPEYLSALHRGDPGALRFRTRHGKELDQLIQAFILRDPVEKNEFFQLLGDKLAAKVIDANIAVHHGPAIVRVVIDVRPHIINGKSRWVFSDPDAAMVRQDAAEDHVPGVGAASLSLLQFCPTTPVDSVLDLGTGSGVQILGQAGSAQKITGTDVSTRALALADATVRGANIADDVTLLAGSWFSPVAGQRFDRIVANPPFVVGSQEITHTYRDSGLDLDGASELVISEAPSYLAPGGAAYLLASWVHVDGQPWQHRVASWLPSRGVAAWVLQRDFADPAHYVSTWLRDEAIDPRSHEASERFAQWLQHFSTHDVTAIGFGYVAIQDIGDQPSEIIAEEIPQAFDDRLADEVEEYFQRAAWLREQSKSDIASSRFQLRPQLAREIVEVPDAAAGMGFSPRVYRLTRMDGPRWSHEVDEHVAAIVAGLHPDGLPLEEVVAMYALGYGLSDDELLDETIGVIVDLVRHGMVLPAELVDAEARGGADAGADADNES